MTVKFEGYASVANRTVEANDTDWDTVHDSAGENILTNYDTPNFVIFAGSYLSGGLHHIRRGFLDFDTSDILSTYQLVSGALQLYIHTSSGITASNPVHITQGVQDIPVVIANYGAQLTQTASGGSQGSMATGAYRTITLNAAGLALINKGSTTKLCIRGDVDLLDELPGGTYTSHIYFYSAQKGGDYRPLLTLNYYKSAYPSSSMARVSSIRHICRPGFNRMEVGLGDLGFDIDVAETTVRKALDTAKAIEAAEEWEARVPTGADVTKIPEKTAMDRLLDIARQQRDTDYFPASAKITAPQPTPPVTDVEKKWWEFWK